MSSDSDKMMSLGNLFRKTGPAIEDKRLPYVLSLTLVNGTLRIICYGILNPYRFQGWSLTETNAVNTFKNEQQHFKLAPIWH